MNRPVAVIIDGPTQVGRSTTIAALQRQWAATYAAPLAAVGLDSAFTVFGPEVNRWQELLLPRRSPIETFGAHYGPLGRELTAAMHRAAHAWLTGGFDVVIEHTFLDRQCSDDLAAVFADEVTIWIGLTCDNDILAAREREAGREEGRGAAEQAAGLHVAKRDLVLDTGEATTEELVAVIMTTVADIRRRT